MAHLPLLNIYSTKVKTMQSMTYRTNLFNACYYPFR